MLPIGVEWDKVAVKAWRVLIVAAGTYDVSLNKEHLTDRENILMLDGAIFIPCRGI